MKIYVVILTAILVTISGFVHADMMEYNRSVDRVVCGDCYLVEKDARAFHASLHPVLVERDIDKDKDLVYFVQKNEIKHGGDCSFVSVSQMRFLVIKADGTERMGRAMSDTEPFALNIQDRIKLAQQAVTNAFDDKKDEVEESGEKGCELGIESKKVPIWKRG